MSDAGREVHLRRTELVTPASDESMMRKAAGTDADEVVLDLEDAVAPDEKPDARERLVEVLESENWGDTRVAFRVNGLDTRWWHRDLIAVVGDAGDRVDDVVVPKVSTAADVHAVATLLDGVEANAGLEAGSVGVEVQIEDGEGMNNAAGIARASDRVDALVFGPGDYSAAVGAPGLDVGRPPEYPGHYWHYPLSRLNHAAKSAGVACVDGPYADFRDEEGFREACERTAALGCDGTWVIHPAQIDIANEVFAPDPETARRAERIVEAYREAQAEGRGAVEVDGQMVDEATHKMALEVVARARAAGLL